MLMDKKRALVWILMCVAKRNLIAAITYPECEENESVGFIENTRANCKYDQIYCNGEESMLCNATTCNEEFVCSPESLVKQNQKIPDDLLAQCSNLVEQYIDIKDTDCGYDWILCNGDDTMLCNSAACDPEFQCKETTTATPTTSSSGGTTATTSGTSSSVGSTVLPPKYMDCIGVANGGFVKNSNSNCEYNWIYCNGDNSMLCNAEVCDSNFVCRSSTTPPTTESIRDQCKESDGLHPFPANSNYYYQCQNGFLTLQQCGFRLHFNPQTGYCELTT